jgi:cysteinyl-tRNA synthetase
MHNGLLKLRTPDGKEDKMAGSIGNVLNVADALNHVSGDLLRFFLLGTHYRSPIDLGTWDPKAEPIPTAIATAKRSYDTFLRFAERAQRVLGHSFTKLPAAARADSTRDFSKSELREYYRRFLEYMDDDFNTGGATAVLFELVTFLNKLADVAKLELPTPTDPAAKQAFAQGAALVREIGNVLGLTFAAEPVELGGGNELVAGLLQLLIDIRNNLRNEAKKISAKDDTARKAMFDQTDVIRKRLAELGVTLEDRPGGTGWRIGS